MDDPVLHTGTIGHERIISGLINDGSDIGGRLGRIPHIEHVHRPAQHFQRMFSNVLLQQQQPQRRTALASGLEARHNDIAHNLFRQGR